QNCLEHTLTYHLDLNNATRLRLTSNKPLWMNHPHHLKRFSRSKEIEMNHQSGRYRRVSADPGFMPVMEH
ncbi:MAG: hypothetical protein ABSD41_04685, partial [Candidatus Bathyarchaeia archaeon]